MCTPSFKLFEKTPAGKYGAMGKAKKAVKRYTSIPEPPTQKKDKSSLTIAPKPKGSAKPRTIAPGAGLNTSIF